jgi:hypothetical protein
VTAPETPALTWVESYLLNPFSMMFIAMFVMLVIKHTIEHFGEKR